jgi:RNA polymerase sigma factor (sigma-70 family)
MTRPANGWAIAYAPLVKYVAGRLCSGLPDHVDEGDLVSYGLLGLNGAIERYDPARDVKFETYAMARIKGQMMDELRSRDSPPLSPAEIIDELRSRDWRPDSPDEPEAEGGPCRP